MNILLRTRRLLKISGFIPIKCLHSVEINLIQNILTFCVATLSVVCSLLYTINADDIYDSTNSFAVLVSMIVACSSYAALIQQKEKLIDFINDLEHMVNKRMEISTSHKNLYEKSDSRVEKLTKTVNFWANILVCLAFLSTTLSTILFVHFDCGNVAERWQLLFPMA